MINIILYRLATKIEDQFLFFSMEPSIITMCFNKNVLLVLKYTPNNELLRLLMRWIQLRSAILVLMRLLAKKKKKMPYEVF